VATAAIVSELLSFSIFHLSITKGHPVVVKPLPDTPVF